MRELLPYLRYYDRQWFSIKPDQMKTTKPRTLISLMNTHVARILAKPDLMQKLVDAFPQLQDETAEPQATEK